ncbi:hypothetical protein [Tamaricihabitans halophyticus]|nr:hypothetical protein [Tamaricihabitans halophyticus]
MACASQTAIWRVAVRTLTIAGSLMAGWLLLALLSSAASASEHGQTAEDAPSTTDTITSSIATDTDREPIPDLRIVEPAVDAELVGDAVGGLTDAVRTVTDNVRGAAPPVSTPDLPPVSLPIEPPGESGQPQPSRPDQPASPDPTPGPEPTTGSDSTTGTGQPAGPVEQPAEPSNGVAADAAPAGLRSPATDNARLPAQPNKARATTDQTQTTVMPTTDRPAQHPNGHVEHPSPTTELAPQPAAPPSGTAKSTSDNLGGSRTPQAILSTTGDLQLLPTGSVIRHSEAPTRSDNAGLPVVSPD